MVNVTAFQCLIHSFTCGHAKERKRQLTFAKFVLLIDIKTGDSTYAGLQKQRLVDVVFVYKPLLNGEMNGRH